MSYIAPALTRPPLLRFTPVLTTGPQPMLPVLKRPALPSPRLTADAAQIASAFCRVLAETIDGRRPLGQLMPALAPRPAQVVADLRHRWGVSGVRPQRVRCQVPREGAIEAAVRLATPSGSAAVALRLEKSPSGWIAVALETAVDGDSHPQR